MPMHDWSQVEPNVYHDFHQAWALQIRTALNAGLLPTGYTALVEQHSTGLVQSRRVQRGRMSPSDRAVVVAQPEPDTRLRIEVSAEGWMRMRASRVAIRYRMGEVVCVIEIVSPGNKAGVRVIRSFVDKTVGFLEAGVNVLLVDPFPPTPRDPKTLHQLVWTGLTGEDAGFDPPADEPLLLASYLAADPSVGLGPEANLEPFRVGAALPGMPAWLDGDFYVNVPLEAAYQAAWQTCSADMRYLVEHGRLPEE